MDSEHTNNLQDDVSTVASVFRVCLMLFLYKHGSEPSPLAVAQFYVS